MNENWTFDSQESTDATNCIRICMLLVSMAIVLAGVLWLVSGNAIITYGGYRINKPFLAFSPLIFGAIGATLAIASRRKRPRNNQRTLPLAVIACIAIAIVLIGILALGLML